jgi:hypothetical protein
MTKQFVMRATGADLEQLERHMLKTFPNKVGRPFCCFGVVFGCVSTNKMPDAGLN